MAKEIEKRYLIDVDLLKKTVPNIFDSGTKISQGYIAEGKDFTVVRSRVSGDKGYLTVKGKNIGIVRPEFEYEIPKKDAEEMLLLFCDDSLPKTRYLLEDNKHTWEIDVFHGNNDGLIIAEIELRSQDEKHNLPSWIIKDISDDPRYYNSNLIKNPYNTFQSTPNNKCYLTNFFSSIKSLFKI